MEEEINLRPLIKAVVRQWRLFLGVVALAVAAAVVLTLVLPRAATARGDVLLIARTPQLTLDARFVDRDATMLTNSINQRQALVDLATSPELESRVAEKLGITEYDSGELLARVAITARSDLLRIETSGRTPEEAEQLAKTWATSYEAFVNEVYTGGTQLEGPIDRAQQDYESAQADLSAFYTGGDLVRAQQTVSRMEGLLDGGTSAQIALYTHYLTRTQELNLILEDARALQAQFEESDASSLGTSLATLAVRARLAGAGEFPVQLNFDNAEAFASSEAATANLAEFIRVLEAQRDRIVAEAEGLAGDLATGDSSAVGLPPNVRTQYESELAAAKSALSQAESQEKRLILQRDMAYRALEVLQAKRNERQVNEVVPEVSVRFVGAAVQPPRSVLASLVINTVAAVAVSFALVLAFVVGRELLRYVGTARPQTPPATERAADTPVATD